MIRGSLADFVLQTQTRHSSGSIKKHLTEAARRDIVGSEDPQHVIAKRWGVSAPYVSRLRHRGK